MDTTAVAIAAGGTALFIGVLIWKGLWFLRKINEDPEESQLDSGADRRDAADDGPLG